MSRHALIAGCGFVGEAAADLFHAAGWRVTGWTASEASAARLAAAKPYAAQAQDITDPANLARAAGGMGKVDALVDCVSSGRGGADRYRAVYLEGARALLAAFPAARFVFAGSTSVYAQTSEEWVDEASPAEPSRETGRILRETEELVLARGGSVARLAGLYGPGRGVMLRRFLDGEAIIEGDGSRWMNFCHRDDAASALFALTDPSAPPGVYNAADDAPLRQRDCYEAMSAIFGRPLPPHGPEDRDRKRGWTSKQVSNRRLRALGWQPRYPSYLDWIREEAASRRSEGGDGQG